MGLIATYFAVQVGGDGLAALVQLLRGGMV